MKILVVAQYYRPDITAAAFRIAETVDLLLAAGHEVTVITSEPHRAQAGAPTGASQQPSALSQPGAAPQPTEYRPTGSPLPADPQVFRVPIDPLTGSGMKPYLRHFFSFVLRARKTVRRLVRAGYRPEAIWVSSPPLFVGLVGTAARRAFQAPLVLDIRDVWPDTAVAAGQISRDGRAYRIGRALERWLYRKADAFSCVAAPMAEYLRREASESGSSGGSSVSVVYNGAGFDPPPPVPIETVEKRVLYAGNLGRLQGIDALIAAWAQLDTDTRNGWTLDLIGGGVMEDDLRRQVDDLGVAESVRFLGVRTKVETVEAMRTAGVLFLNLLARPVFDLTIPSKLFDYLAVGRPVIGGISGEGRTILNELPGNLTVRPNDVEEIAGALRMIIASGDWSRSLPENQRIVRERFSRRVNTEKLARLFSDVIGTGAEPPQ